MSFSDSAYRMETMSHWPYPIIPDTSSPLLAIASRFVHVCLLLAYFIVRTRHSLVTRSSQSLMFPAHKRPFTVPDARVPGIPTPHGPHSTFQLQVMLYCEHLLHRLQFSPMHHTIVFCWATPPHNSSLAHLRQAGQVVTVPSGKLLHSSTNLCTQKTSQAFRTEHGA
ncbi:unnamed protein product [Protopolystoma xenopodis]|uniref:Uncharacterized protein n=1 Tax=Protopolystoma xenopodis TaxID=117903 RepID=A0A3S5FE77_9PLAT|nr:unnamed protein product [Protopolystoma xenopodis]